MLEQWFGKLVQINCSNGTFVGILEEYKEGKVKLTKTAKMLVDERGMMLLPLVSELYEGEAVLWYGAYGVKQGSDLWRQWQTATSPLRAV